MLLRFTRIILASAALAAAGFARAAETSAAPLATPLTREQLLSSLVHELVSHFNFEGDLQLELLRPWTPPPRIAGVWQIEVLEFPSVASSTLLLRCRVLADAAPVAETTFVLRASLWRDAWITRQPLTTGLTFDTSLLEARRIDLLRDRDALPAAVGDRSYVFARAVPAGRLLTWHDIARRPLVKKGEIVEVSAIEGPLVVTMKGLAMENGSQGDTVTIRNPESQKNFAALVIDENRVQVRF